MGKQVDPPNCPSRLLYSLSYPSSLVKVLKLFLTNNQFMIRH